MPGASVIRSRFAAPIALWLIVAGLTTACSKEAPLPPPQGVDVTAITIEPKDAPVVFEFVGQMQSSREVEIRARVDGFLELNLSYAPIATPLTGLSSFAKIQEGAYVNASNNLLTYVAQLDPMWVNFSVSENQHLRLREAAGNQEKFWNETRFSDGTRFFDYKHAETGASILKAQHPEFELWSQGVHARAGVACSDCHMPYVRDGATKISDHWVRSPLLNINNACQTCHRVSEEEIKARVDVIQTRNFELMQRGGALAVAGAGRSGGTRRRTRPGEGRGRQEAMTGNRGSRHLRVLEPAGRRSLLIQPRNPRSPRGHPGI